ncbi:MAG: acetaldehyde dehydrogenase (acetylating) [Oscillospiraceae bacterium]|nr:acetaldehyde dehydrogenase (acetylating) [Oscillospiraceae bacterium]
MHLDHDLQSIQSAREIIRNARVAANALAGFSQAKLDSICAEIAREGEAHARRLAELAVEETGFGRMEDKVLKNLLGSRMTWEAWKDIPAVGILREDKQIGLMEVGVPVGVIAALVPSTNPTSTTLYKAIIALKAGNAIIFSPHPNAKRCILETVQVIQNAAQRAGAPEHAVQSLSLLSKEATETLLRDPCVGLILATGGGAMVRAAYRSGNPAIGVGPGNGPAFIERSADIPKAVGHIIESKTFDNGVICASEQSIVTEHCIASQVEKELTRQSCYFLSESESAALAKLFLRPDGTMNPGIVGRTAPEIAALANISVPEGTRVLISRQEGVSPQNAWCHEKLCPALAYYVEPDWEAACQRCLALLAIEGAGHTMVIHSKDEAVIREFALQKPVSRLLVNTPAALGGVGATTGLAPALTLGCGSAGGSATSDNVGPLHLRDIRRVAWGVRELDALRTASSSPAGDGLAFGADAQPVGAAFLPPEPAHTRDIAAITRKVMERLRL